MAEALWAHLHFGQFALEVVTRARFTHAIDDEGSAKPYRDEDSALTAALTAGSSNGLNGGYPSQGDSSRGDSSRDNSAYATGKARAAAASSEALPDIPPLIITEGEGARAEIVALDARAYAAGLRVGMSLKGAWALAAGLTVCRRDEDVEREALESIAAWALRFSSLVTVYRPCGVSLEIGGSLALFGGVERLLEDLQRGLGELGYTVSIAVAPTPGGARILAKGLRALEERSLQARPAGSAQKTARSKRERVRRTPVARTASSDDGTKSGLARSSSFGTEPLNKTDHAQIVVRTRSELVQALSARPLEHLLPELPMSSYMALKKLGLATLGECVALPRKALNRRVEAVIELLDRAHGERPDPQVGFEPPACFRENLPLPVPVRNAEALLFGLKRLVSALVGYLEARATGAMGLVVDLVHESGSRDVLEIRLVAPNRDPGHLMMLLREALERQTLQDDVARIELAVPFTGERAPLSEDLFDPGPGATEHDLAELVERLGARLGREQINGLARRSDHRPERAWQTRPVSTPVSTSVSASVSASVAGGSAPFVRTGDASPAAPGAAKSVPYPRTTDSDAAVREHYMPAGQRPSWLLPRPLALTVVDGRPVWQGPLVLERGPERIESGWWDGMDVSRDYFFARSPRGERLWIFEDRRAPGHWYLHGIFA